jgi:hypothetical protein
MVAEGILRIYCGVVIKYIAMVNAGVPVFYQLSADNQSERGHI